MVCLGNICRSPLAEGITRHLIEERNLDWEVDSVGTIGWHEGNPPDERSIDSAAARDIDISSQRSRRVTYDDLVKSDLIVAMDAQNYQDILRLHPKAKEKLHLMMNYLHPSENREVPDPYHGTPQDFQNVFDLLFEACESMLNHLEKSKST